MIDPVSLITTGAGLLGSLFGRKSRQETTTSESTSKIDYQGMVDAASAAGFNPLTAIRTGGASGFVTTNTKTTGPASGGGGGGIGGIIEAAGQFGGALLGSFNQPKIDPIKTRSKTNTALVDYQLRGAVKRPAGSLYSPAQTTGVKVSSARPMFGPDMPAHLKLDKPMAMYVTAIDDNGKRHRIANPDLPDLDQLFVPSPAVVASEARDAYSKSGTWWDSLWYRQPSLVPAQVGKKGRYARP